MTRSNHVANSHVERQARRDSAHERDTFNASLTPQGRIARLDERLGAGVGAKKERARLAAQMTPKQKSNAKKKEKTK
jgi:hypothetical protein